MSELMSDVPDTSPTPWIGPHGQRMRRLEFHITYHCPERCSFCSEEHRMEQYSAFPVTFARVATVLRQQAARGVDHVHFTGGEPTIHPQFIAVLQLAKKLGMRTSIGSIGTRLADPAFAALALPLLDEALLSLHGPDAATHDALTRRAGSFDRLMRAAAHAAASPGFRLYINSVLTRQNAGRFVETTRLARSLGAQLQIISNLTPEGAGEDNYDDLVLPLSDLRRLAPQILDAAGPMIVRFFGAPMCVLGPARLHSNDLHWNPRVTVEWTSQPGKVVLDGIYAWSPERRRRHAPPCEGCRDRSLCSGVFDRYLERRGDHELQPAPVTENL